MQGFCLESGFFNFFSHYEKNGHVESGTPLKTTMFAMYLGHDNEWIAEQGNHILGPARAAPKENGFQVPHPRLSQCSLVSKWLQSSKVYSNVLMLKNLFMKGSGIGTIIHCKHNSQSLVASQYQLMSFGVNGIFSCYTANILAVLNTTFDSVVLNFSHNIKEIGM